MYQPGDLVEVLQSKRGYKGPGAIVDVAFSNHYLVKVTIGIKETVITVRFQDLRRSHTETVVIKKKR